MYSMAVSFSQYTLPDEYKQSLRLHVCFRKVCHTSPQITKCHQGVLSNHVLEPLPKDVYLMAAPCLGIIWMYKNEKYERIKHPSRVTQFALQGIRHVKVMG